MPGRGWTSDELAYLRSRAGQEPYAAIAAHLGRSLKAVHHQARRMGLYAPGWRRHVWTEADEALLREHYRRMPTSWLIERIGATNHAIHRRAKVLGLTRAPLSHVRWTRERDWLLREAWGIVPTHRLAKQLQTTPAALGSRARKLGLNALDNKATVAIRDRRRIARLRVLLACALDLLSPMDAAARLGCRPDQVRRIALHEAAAATDAAGKASQRHGEAREPHETRSGLSRTLRGNRGAKVEVSA